MLTITFKITGAPAPNYFWAHWWIPQVNFFPIEHIPITQKSVEVTTNQASDGEVAYLSVVYLDASFRILATDEYTLEVHEKATYIFDYNAHTIQEVLPAEAEVKTASWVIPTLAIVGLVMLNRRKR